MRTEKARAGHGVASRVMRQHFFLIVIALLGVLTALSLASGAQTIHQSKVDEVYSMDCWVNALAWSPKGTLLEADGDEGGIGTVIPVGARSQCGEVMSMLGTINNTLGDPLLGVGLAVDSDWNIYTGGVIVPQDCSTASCVVTAPEKSPATTIYSQDGDQNVWAADSTGIYKISRSGSNFSSVLWASNGFTQCKYTGSVANAALAASPVSGGRVYSAVNFTVLPGGLGLSGLFDVTSYGSAEVPNGGGCGLWDSNQFGPELGFVTGMAQDKLGNLYVVESSTGNLYKVVPWTGGYSLVGNYSDAQTVAVDGNGNIFVATTGSWSSPVYEILTDGGNMGSGLAKRTFHFSFDAGGTLGDIKVLTNGTEKLDYTNLGTGSCVKGNTYQADTECTVDVAFTPKYAGERNGAIVIKNSAGEVISTTFLRGTGTMMALTFGPGTQAQVGASLGNPAGAALDGAGDLFVADSKNNAVYEIAAGASAATQIGSGFNAPTGVAVDGAGNVIVADSNSGSVKLISKATGYTATLTLASDFGVPQAVAVDGSGNIYVADSTRGKVVELTESSHYATETTLASSLSTPTGVAVDGSGNLFVVLAGSGSVDEIPAGGGTPLAIGGHFLAPQAIAVDDPGNVYVATPGTVYELPASASYAQTNPLLGLSVTNATGIAIDPAGNPYVVDAATASAVKLDVADPPALTFGPTYVGATSAAQMITITNAGSEDINLSQNIYGYGATPGIFALLPSGWGFNKLPVTGSDCTTVAGLTAPGGQCELAFDFAPTATTPNPATADVMIQYQNDQGRWQYQYINMTGNQPQIQYINIVAMPGLGTQSWDAQVGQTVTVIVSASSGLAATVTSEDPAVCTVSGTSVQLLTAGYCFLMAKQAGNAAYLPVQREIDFQVYPGSQTVTLNAPATGIYGATVTVTGTSTAGLSVTLSASGNCANNGNNVTFTSGNGSCFLQGSQAGNANWNAAQSLLYTVNLAQAKLQVVADNKSVTLGGNEPTLTYHLNGLLLGDTATAISGQGNPYTTINWPSPVGTYPIIMDPGSLWSNNYTFTPVNGVLTVTAPPKVTLSVSVQQVAGSQYSGYTTYLYIMNNGTGAAANLQVSAATLGAATGQSLPISLGSLAAGSSTTATINFPASAGNDSATVMQKYTVSYTGGSQGLSGRVVLP